MNLENYQSPNNVQQARPEYRPQVENEHTIAVVLGYILAILIPLFGIIVGIYLITRNDSEKAKMHGKLVIGLSILIWVLSFLLIR